MSDRLILLVDCHALLYRGHFAMMRNPLRAKDGMNTSGLFFLVREILERREARDPDAVAAVFDHPAPTFRVDIYPEYKANRPPMPEELRKQTELAHELIPALGVPLLEREGFEADDIIASLALEAERRGDRAEILSSDKDLLQLASDRITVIRPGRSQGQDVLVNRGGVVSIMGVRADQVADFLALTGDSSDNVPGARGIGRKTAAGLLRDHGSLQGIYGEIDEVSPSVRKKLTEDREKVELSLRLVSLVPPRDTGFSVDDISMMPEDGKRASEILTRLGMTSIMEKLGIAPADDLFGGIGASTESTCRTIIIGSLDDLRELQLTTGDDGLLALDTETTSRDPFEAEPVGLSIAASPDRAWYAPLSGPDALDPSEVATILSDRLGGMKVAAQNGKYDMHVLDMMGFRIPELSGDPMIADYLLRPEVRSHSLSSLSAAWLRRQMEEYSEVLGEARTLKEVETSKVAAYCCSDSATALELARLLHDELAEDPLLLSLYRDLELPLVRILADMEARGVGLDIVSLNELEEEFDEAIRKLEAEASEAVGAEINLNSPSQVSDVLFDTLGLDPVRKTAKGANSSSMEVLEKLRGRHAFVETVIQHRELSKLLNTYVRKLPGFVCSRDGLIHTSFSQTVAATGRLSSSNPNLQNIPIRTSRGRCVRKCFVPGRRGRLFVTADYSQIELRILAHFAGPGSLRSAYERGEDIHGKTAEAVFGDSSPNNRRKAKEVNFSILYGISPWGLSNRINISRGEASEIIDRYVSTYPEVESFFTDCVGLAAENGETRTILGRKREFRGMDKARGAARSSMERMAVNTTIQGSAADIIKLAMLKVDARLRQMKGAGLVLQVHDELVATAPVEMADEVARVLKEEMEGAFPLEVPLVVDTGTGANWLEAQH